jgi:hypothetical protein
MADLMIELSRVRAASSVAVLTLSLHGKALRIRGLRFFIERYRGN